MEYQCQIRALPKCNVTVRIATKIPISSQWRLVAEIAQQWSSFHLLCKFYSTALATFSYNAVNLLITQNGMEIDHWLKK